jgi:hypothetical protein
VIAFDQHQRDVGMARAPDSQRVLGRPAERFRRMQQITEKNQRARPGPFDQIGQTRQVGAGGSVRHRDAVCAKGRSLADVHVGDDQHRARFPERRAFRQEQPIVAGDRRLDGVRAHGTGVILKPRARSISSNPRGPK